MNDQGQVLFQKRSANKKHFPNIWALCTGHVEKGESPKEAALRELNEELGITVSLEQIFSFSFGRLRHLLFLYFF